MQQNIRSKHLCILPANDSTFKSVKWADKETMLVFIRSANLPVLFADTIRLGLKFFILSTIFLTDFNDGICIETFINKKLFLMHIYKIKYSHENH